MQISDIKIKDSIRIKSWEELEAICHSSNGRVSGGSLYYKNKNGTYGIAFYNYMRDMCDKVFTVKSKYNGCGGYIYINEHHGIPVGAWAIEYISGHDPIGKITAKELDELLIW